MLIRATIYSTVMGLSLLAGCAPKPGPAPAGEPVPPAPDTETKRPPITAADCEAKGGRVVGDIGDGAIHRPDYTCEGGQPPLGSITPTEGGPIAVEGSVCCPAS